MPTIFDPDSAKAIHLRLDRLAPDAPPLWGRMSASQMVCHLTDSCKVALGETATTLKPGILSNRLVRWLIISVFPFPRGKAPTSREFLLTRPADWEADRRTFRQYFDRVQAKGQDPQAKWNVHPSFGAMGSAQYGKLMHKHMDHHLRQFGV